MTYCTLCNSIQKIAYGLVFRGLELMVYSSVMNLCVRDFRYKCDEGV